MTIRKMPAKQPKTSARPPRGAPAQAEEFILVFEGRKMVVRRAGPDDAFDPFATFSEWDSEADRRGYADL
ncbi:MAG: transcriptional regulator [Devosia nanyangense]|uniref:Transcriptional regulator n=1 Tax=Devosia nanyangense TaxID=1228055 RepID=A0A933KXK7_9HYPH|nr:transcriptional regulator [Devosia nanyangense]